MESRLRIITHLPLKTGSVAAKPLESDRVGEIGSERIRKLLREESPSFVVADVGHPLRWISSQQRFAFWKDEVQCRLVEPDQDRIQLSDYPEEYCYRASEWRHRSESHVTIVLEKQH